MVQQTDFTKFLEIHETQLKSSDIPARYWQTLYIKLKNQIFDSNNTFNLLKIDYEDEVRCAEDPLWTVQIKDENGIKHTDENHIYLIDHTWTFRASEAKQQLLQVPNLLERMCNLMGVDHDQAAAAADAANEVCDLMWKYCQTYSIGNAANIEDRLPIWYILDELGCGIQHSDDPNFRAVPFFYISDQITFTLIYPVKDVEFEDTVTRDFVEGVSESFQRKAQLIPWIRSDLSAISYVQDEPGEDYFLSGHVRETLPQFDDFVINIPDKIKVYSEYSMVNKFLTHDRFELTSDETIADVLWYTHHFKTFAELSQNNPNKFVNQFPFENVLTIKDLLSIICRRNSKANWYPITYNLKTELPKFISYYQNREKLGLNNLWICKPWNLARSLDTHITKNIDHIVRLTATGPKIAQKYIETPVLFNRPEVGNVKFDIRYVILLKSVQPLKAFIYNNFFLRFSNKPFELTDFDDYEKHFTVMNYSDETKLHHLPCADFLSQWYQQYPGFTWREIQNSIVKMLREMLEAAVLLPPPRGIASSTQSRAVYAADIMLSWNCGNIEPKLLEINWTPDCKRACDYYPEFYNDIFSCLFLNDDTCNDSFTTL